MAKLIFDGKEIDVPDGEPIKEYGRQLGVPFGFEHGGCGTCKIDILSGAENLN